MLHACLWCKKLLVSVLLILTYSMVTEVIKIFN